MKLYVWEDVLPEVNYGIAFVFAENVKEGRKLMFEKHKKKYGYVDDDFKKEFKKKPREINTPEAFYMYGSA